LKELHRARRVGACAIAFACLLRLCSAGVPENLYLRYVQPNIDALLTKLETGRNVRFSSSMEPFSPDFVETPPPSMPEATEAPLPAFSGEEEIDLYYAVRKDPDIESLLTKPLDWNLFGQEPSVLILHTHTTESYTKRGEDYKETSSWRTLEEGYNMLSIGNLVAEILKNAGIGVIHEKTLHDYPSYNGSYIRSRQSLRERLKESGNIRLVLDLHRDAAGEGANQMRTLAKADGEDSAQLMVVIGTNHDGYEENLSLGLKLHVQLEQQNPGIMRPLQLRPQRFNQDLSPGALLIEVGAAGNNHKEARIAAAQLAKAIIALGKGTV
jgi:stage II sporulation protein P